MKKIAIAMVILLALGSFAFGETVVGGEFEFKFGLLDNAHSADNWHDAEISVKSDVDDFNSIAIELDYEAANAAELMVDHAKLTTDLAGALGLEGFTLSSTVGLFDSWFTDWNFNTWNEIEYHYGQGSLNTYMVRLDAGVDAGGVHLIAPVDGSDMLLGADFDVAGVNGWLWYDMDLVAETSVFGGEVDYAMDALTLYTSFSYGLDSEYYTAGVSVGYEMGILDVGAAFSYDQLEVMKAEIDLVVSPTEEAAVWAYTNLDLTSGAADVLDTLELGGSYKFGAAKLSIYADVMADEIAPTAKVGIFF
jgi:hypothetical protein